MGKRYPAAVLAVCLLAAPVLAVDDLVIDRRQDWEAWSFPAGTLEITPDGRVRATRMRKDINPVLNASDFTYEAATGGPATGGIRAAGSNVVLADRIMDGDSSTSWAPNANDPLKDWWIEVDLGRSVAATELKLVFDEAGPPFSDFRIFVSTGELKFSGLKLLDYVPIIQTRSPNEEHVFAHQFEVADILARPLSGRLFQYVKIIFDRKVAGAALAELELRSLGDNIAGGTLARGGRATSGQNTNPSGIFDGSLWTLWKMTNLGSDWLQGKNLVNGPWIRWDLGAEFWIDTMKLHASGESASANNSAGPPMDGFRIFYSDGKEGTVMRHSVWQVDKRNVDWEMVTDVNNTLNAPDFLGNFEFRYDPPKKARYVFFHHFYGASVWQTGYALGSSIFEFQLFGDGFLPGAELQSPLLEIEDAYVNAIEWQSETPPGTRLEIQTRTGDAVEEITTYFDKNGNKKTEDQYNTLPSSFRGEVVVERLPIEEEWIPWSLPYTHSGAAFVSPSPSKFLLIKVKLVSDSPQVAASLDQIVLRLAEPVVHRITGRIQPSEVEPGVSSNFTYFLQPSFRFGNSGFDRILIQTPSPAQDVQVLMGGQEIAPDEISASTDSLIIVLPSTVTRQGMEIRFSAVPQSDNTVFGAAVARGTGTWQRVDPESRSALVVRIPAFGRSDALIHDLRIEPPIFTPNGDGINDGVSVRFAVLKVDVPRQVRVDIYDLAGRFVTSLFDGLSVSGAYGESIVWRGEDRAGERVPPGIYLCRVEVRGDAGSEARQRLVSLIY